ncbi:hypothetical protein FSC37_22220 [Piscinibacter aquaticus]|uniref:Uncharacterized protein n=1 Tax=Piscinibacter aquaticus TaxID=392597 RepID=A0A5C6TMY4_9BURK|nr:hypothetical protein FSC37_22220 [Piscinibacter aquaticus]
MEINVQSSHELPFSEPIYDLLSAALALDEFLFDHKKIEIEHKARKNKIFEESLVEIVGRAMATPIVRIHLDRSSKGRRLAHKLLATAGLPVLSIAS